ncbi:MAG: 50S ribosomal protein L28 [Bacilli bacterium]|nr:50S ribosomal protein L28 [Bacilli bacterium]MCR5309668.1 50S ribosomal protein L28 [Bacilli bacterium]
MARVCPVSGKGPLTGNNRSHSLRATRRRWNCNLQVRTIVVDGKPMRVKMSTRAYRSLNKQYKER